MTSVNPVPDHERHLYLLIGTLFTRLNGHLGEPGPGELRRSQLRVLHGVGDGVSVSVLAERVGMTKQAAGQFVTTLVGSGHLEVGSDPADARVRLVRRTALGERSVREFTDEVTHVEESLRDEVGRERYNAFREVLVELALRTQSSER